MAPAQAVRAALAANPSVRYTANQPRKVVYAADGAPVLGYEAVLAGVKADRTPSRLHVVTDANTGRILAGDDEIKQLIGVATGRSSAARPGSGSRTGLAATGTGRTEYSGAVSL
ncbi:hypothetical protein [Sciscionella marina]|uniref:hypothetical protein n=1 Tax=Sciscionella marina TaxID=508770 RepID=UPI00035C11DA|nr:hypothetical protein [Sciscionella marina]